MRGNGDRNPTDEVGQIQSGYFQFIKKLIRIVIHTQYYVPEIGAPQARLSELAQGLSERGFEVTVLTAFPNYPTGKIFKGYKGIFSTEAQKKVKVIRCSIYPAQKASLAPRLLNYFSFVISSLLAGFLLVKRTDYFITESPPLFLGISGFILSRLKAARWIFNVSDLWPESAVRLGIIKPGPALRISEMLEGFCYRKAWAVTGQSKTILQDITARYSNVQTYHLSNGADPDLFHPDVTPRHLYEKTDSELIAIYAGLHGLAQGLDQILSVAHYFEGMIQFIFIGDGPTKNELIALSEELNLSNVLFLEPRAKEEMPGIIAAADICIVPLKSHLPGAVPSKIYESMAAGKPIVLIAAGEAADIIKKSAAGIVVNPGDAAGLIKALQVLASDQEVREAMGRSGRKAVEAHFDRQLIIERFASYLQNGVRNPSIHRVSPLD